METEKDLFDRIMDLPILRIFRPFYQKHKEVLLYLFFGFVTTVISVVVYWLGADVAGISNFVFGTERKETTGDCTVDQCID